MAIGVLVNTKGSSAGAADTRTNPNGRSGPPRSNTFPEEAGPRCSLMAFKLSRMRSVEQTGLRALTQLSFLHSAWPACFSSSPVCGNTHFSFFAFPFPSPVKHRLGNEWGPFPQRGSGNVKTDLPLTPLPATLSRCAFNVAGLTRQLG